MPELHPQLQQDCHEIASLPSGRLLLMRNALLHWFILVPDTDAQDLLDLPDTQLTAVMADCRRISSLLKGTLGYPKVNFAGLGNVVPQMHLHLIGRREGDACWPKPVWGKLPEGPDWSAEELDELTSRLALHR